MHVHLENSIPNELAQLQHRPLSIRHPRLLLHITTLTTMLLQALGSEAMQLLWALADNSPAAVTALEGCNLELGQRADLEGGPWESVLVGCGSRSPAL